MKTFEIEKKYKLRDPQKMRKRLRQLGAKKRKSGREDNQFWDLAGKLETRKMTLRLRRHEAEAVLTLKGPRQSQGQGIDKRLELETPVDYKAAEKILRVLGFKQRLRYTKTREVYRFGNAIVTLDDLSRHGWFLEIEGTAKAILAAEKKLGLTSADAEPRSYLAMILKKKNF